MKIKIAKTYQAVEFLRQMHTYFSERPGMEGIQIESLPHALKISCKGEHIVVPFANVAYYKLLEEEKPKKLQKDQ